MPYTYVFLAWYVVLNSTSIITQSSHNRLYQLVANYRHSAIIEQLFKKSFIAVTFRHSTAPYICIDHHCDRASGFQQGDIATRAFQAAKISDNLTDRDLHIYISPHPREYNWSGNSPRLNSTPHPKTRSISRNPIPQD